MKDDSILSKGILNKSKISDDDFTIPKNKTIVLAGNPNVGKSLFFNHLSGIYVDVSNFPGTTVTTTKAKYKNHYVYDTPGVYGLSSFTDEEKVARDILLKGDVVLNIVNALHLERDLFFTQQLIDMGLKISVLLNFSDELKKRKIKIDVERLSSLLGVEVYETSAIKKIGFDKIDDAVLKARRGNKNISISGSGFIGIPANIPEAEKILINEGDNDLAGKFNIEPVSYETKENIFIERRNLVNEIVREVESEDSKKGEFFNVLGRLSLNPLTGIPILAAVLILVYLFIGDIVSQRVVDFTENTLGHEIFEYNVKSFISKYTPAEINVEVYDQYENLILMKNFSFPEGGVASPDIFEDYKIFSAQENSVSDFKFSNPIAQLLFGEFGVITMTITYLLFLLLPLVAGFYFVMAILEDSGYLPRLAAMLDKFLTRFGLNGKAVIPIMLGFGCITMANITTRILGTSREKSIVTAILQFVIPCSAQLAVITVLLSSAGPVPLLIYIVTITTVLITLSTVLNRALPGESSPLLLSLPVMQIPRLSNVFKKTIFRSYGFMKEAGVWFFIGALGIGLMQITGLLEIWQQILAPLTTNWLKLPAETSTAFVMGIVRRDFGAAGLFEMNLTGMQITVAIITITLFVPCIASFVVMLKERGWKEGLSIWFGTWFAAFFVGGIVAQIII
ncbi:ferrous iron transport protein B [Bacteroidota bacterium]